MSGMVAKIFDPFYSDVKGDVRRLEMEMRNKLTVQLARTERGSCLEEVTIQRQAPLILRPLGKWKVNYVL